MKDAEYRFLTAWSLDAALERVWDEIYHVERWTSWWAGLIDFAQLQPGGANRIGYTCRLTWKGALPYKLIVEMKTVRVEPFSLIESKAVGELEGCGIWHLKQAGGGTIAEYDWKVKTTKPWMNRLAFLARPVFSWNHHVVMRRGEAGLKGLLETSKR